MKDVEKSRTSFIRVNLRVLREKHLFQCPLCALLFFSPFVWEEVPVCFGFGSGRHGGRSVEYIRQVVEEVDAHLTA